MLRISKSHIKPLLFVVGLTAFYGLFFLLSDFYDIPFRGFSDLVNILLQFSVVAFATFGVLYLISINRYIFAVTFPLLTAICTILAYFKYTAKVTLTPMLFELAVVNDIRTDMDVVSWQLVLLVIVSFIFAFSVVYYRFKKVTFSFPLIHFLFAFLIIFGVTHVRAFANPLNARIPYNIYYSVNTYFSNRKEIKNVRPDFPGKVLCEDDSVVIVVVLGESVRSSNLQINGYSRPTTPLLCKEKNVLSLPNIYSEEAFTHTSVPYLLTRASHDYPDRAYEERSFVSLFRKAGYRTAWIANQEPVSTFIYFMKECDSLIYVNSGKSLYHYEKWLDEDILPYMDKELEREENRHLLILHTIGSHWWYNAHFPERFERWKPTLSSKVISSNSHEEMLNAYDNTILYSDYFWNAAINRLRHRNAVLIYLSDHGECMGEDGMYTHGADHEALHHPACFVWFSDSYMARHADKVEALRKNRLRKYNSSFLFHSVLSAGGVKCDVFDENEDIFR